MGQTVSSTDFLWTYGEQPHCDRRTQIIKKYPEIKSLFGVDPSLKYVVAFNVIMQTVAALLLRDSSWILIFLQAYFFGGLVNHGLALAIHDISHNTAFGNHKPIANRFFGMFANLPLGVPMSISFKKYHVEHHRYLSEDSLDTDLPTEFEAKFFSNSFTKSLWICFQPLFYAFRPLVIYQKYPTDLEIINLIIQVAYDWVILYFGGIKSLVYLVSGTLLGMGPHPASAHFIAEHYAFNGDQETYSYYGNWNYCLFNVGYHVEHHDFPYIPGRNLPLVRKIAPEFYENLYQHKRWSNVIMEFIFSPNMGPFMRLKRPAKVEQDKVPKNAFRWDSFSRVLDFLKEKFYNCKKIKNC